MNSALIFASVAMRGGLRWLLPIRWLAVVGCLLIAGRKRSLTIWILAGLVAGAAMGYDFPAAAVKLQVLGLIFLRLVKVIIAPLLFGTLVTGIAGHPDLKKVGRMGLKAILYFEIVSTLALGIGLGAIQLSRAGVGAPVAAAAPAHPLPQTTHSATELILNIFPENIAKSISEDQLLQVVIFSILFGIALALVGHARRRPMLELAESLTAAMFKFTNLVMLAAPIGVFGAIAYTVGNLGVAVLLPLLKLLLTLYAALVVFVLGVLLPVALIARVPLRRFLGAVAEPVAIAFGTSSSEAALPRAMEALEKLGVPRPIVAFVMPTGYSFNLDGSSLYQSMALIFVAQAAGIHLTFAQEAVMMLTLLVSSKGTAGVARASIVIVLAAASSFHLPMEPVFLLFAIDPLMDMVRTAVNVLGNCLATVVIARSEREFVLSPAAAPRE